MIEFLQGFHPVVQALFGTLFTWFMTLLGAGVAFFGREISRKVLDSMLGFAGGVMIAASYWSLLAPAIEMSEGRSVPPAPAAVGFVLGVSCCGASTGVTVPSSAIRRRKQRACTTWRQRRCWCWPSRCTTYRKALPSVWRSVRRGRTSSADCRGPLVGHRHRHTDFPEGLAVSAPLRRAGYSRFRSFWVGQLSGLVEPVAGVIGAAAVLVSQALLPYALAFAAGAMIFVVVEELVPESQRGGNGDLATMGVMIGFTVMMILDVALG